MGRFPSPQVSLRDANKLATTNMHNELAAAMLALQPQFVTGQQRPARGSLLTFLARVTNKGPNGEADYTDERYWLKPQYIKGSQSPTDSLDMADDGALLAVTTITAVNLADLSLGGKPNKGPHTVQKDTWVEVTARVDVGTDAQGSQSAQGPAVRYEFCFAPSAVIPVVCVSDGGSDGTLLAAPTYTYKITYNGNDLNTHQTPKNKRTIGPYIQADFGYAHFDATAGKFILGLCNEEPNAGACSA